MAGTVRRISAPAAMPTLSANTMQASGTMPWTSYQVLLYRPPNASASGSSVHPVTSPSSSVAAAAVPKIRMIFVISHRSGLTDCVQTNRCVPASYSRATRGAATNMPATMGTAIRAEMNGGIE